MKVILFISLIGALAFSNCKGTNGHGGEVRENKVPNQDELIEINKSNMQAEDARINAYIKRKKWNMQSTGTGLRYMFLLKADSNSPTALIKQEALVNTEVRLLNGDLVYSTKENGPQWFLIGMSDVESGLHEGIQLMRKGDQARFIMPPHLAHGLVGDLTAIPPNSSIIYDVTLVDLK